MAPGASAVAPAPQDAVKANPAALAVGGRALAELTPTELKEELTRRGLAITGKKKNLLKRLTEAMQGRVKTEPGTGAVAGAGGGAAEGAGGAAQTQPAPDGLLPPSLETFEIDKAAMGGQGNLRKAMDRMFSLRQRLDSRADTSNEWIPGGRGDFTEAQHSLLLISTYFQDEGVAMYMCRDIEDTEGIILEVRDVYRLPSGAPMCIVYWAHETTAAGPSATTKKLLQFMMRTRLSETDVASMRSLKCSVKEMAIIKAELQERAKDLDTTWRKEQDLLAGDGHQCSYISLLEPRMVVTPDGPMPVYGSKVAGSGGAAASKVDITTASTSELRRLIKEAGLDHADCVEKSELRARAAEAMSVLSARDKQQRSCGLPEHFQVSGQDRYVDVLVPNSRKIKDAMYTGDDCCICLEPLATADAKTDEGGDVEALECGHAFHAHCIRGWETEQKNRAEQVCPICRSKTGTEMHYMMFNTDTTLAGIMHPSSKKSTPLRDRFSGGVRRFSKHQPFVLKVQVDYLSGELMVYDQTRELSFVVNSSENISTGRPGMANVPAVAKDIGRAPEADLRLLRRNVAEHGSAKGELSVLGQSMDRNVRGYLQACVVSGEVVRIYADRIYSRGEKWF
jgi:hypothetical protein